MAKAGPKERMRYWFDRTMSKGTKALIGWLASLTLVLIATVTVLVWFVTPRDANDQFNRVVWQSILGALDPGYIEGLTGSPQYIAFNFALSLGGIFIVATLIGVLAAGLNAKLEEMRKGRARVVESDHTVILGWTDQIYTIISELVKAKDEKSCIVVLASRDKVEMEDDIRRHLPHLGRVRVVCRTGKPTEPADLEVARLDDASVIIVPVPEEDEADVHVIKTLLALRTRSWPPKRPPVVAAVADSTNVGAAILAGGDAVQIIDAKDIVARLVVQSRRQPGLSAVWTELLGFDGDEIYMREEPRLVGTDYGEALFAYERAALFGLCKLDGTVLLNPPMEQTIEAGDSLLLIAKNAKAIRPALKRSPVHHDSISSAPHRVSAVEATLILGWNDRGPTIIGLLDRYLPPGSTAEIAVNRPGDALPNALALNPTNLVLKVNCCSPTDRVALEALSPERFQHVMVLAEDDVSARHADSRTLVTLLHLRDMKEKRGDGYAIVSELNDDANRQLAEVTQADDFVIGEKLISLYLTQLSQNQRLAGVFTELFDARGSDIYLRPADEYVVPGQIANFATLIEAARQRGETAIGYRLAREAYLAPGYGVVLNPDNEAELKLGPEDRVVVLARV